MGSLNTWIHVHDDNGRSHVFGPGDEVPDWAAQRITAPGVWAVPPDVEAVQPDGDPGMVQLGGQPPAPDPASQPEPPDPAASTEPVEPAQPAQPVEPAPPAGPVGEVPPRSGTGSSRAAWTAYARANGVEITDSMKTRDDIIAACAAANVATE